MVEDKDTITVKEFKAWLVGLIRGKSGSIPDMDDWKQIKAMMDKIVEEPANAPTPYTPYIPYTGPAKPSREIPPWPYKQYPWTDDNTGYPPGGYIWSGQGINLDDKLIGPCARIDNDQPQWMATVLSADTDSVGVEADATQVLVNSTNGMKTITFDDMVEIFSDWADEED